MPSRRARLACPSSRPETVIDLLKQRRASTPRGTDQEKAWKSTPSERQAFVNARRASEAGRDRDRIQIATSFVADPVLAIDEALGVRELEPGALPGSEAVVAASLDLVERIGFDNLPWGEKKKNMAKYMLDAPLLELGSPFMSLALSDAVIGSVSRYLGVVPVLNYVDLWCSRYIDEPASRSQLWHLDNADVRQVKLFVYCSDVDSACGPLTVIDASASERLSGQIGYSLAEGRVTDEIVDDVLGRDQTRELNGPAGTAYLVDTSRCFHFGSRVSEPGRSRLVAMFQYLTPYAFTYSADHREQAPFRELAHAGLSQTERLVLGSA